MHDELNALRHVYGEEPAAPLGPEDETEAAQLAALKAALDALPSQRPAPAALEAVLSAAAEAPEASLAPVRTVYDADPVPLTTPEAKAEAAAFAEVKVALDALPRQRPAPSLVDAVVSAAAAPTRSRPTPVVAAANRAADRPAVGRSGARRGAVVALSAAFALVLAVGVGLWPDGEVSGPPAVAEQAIPSGEGAPDAPVLADAVPVGAATAEPTASTAAPAGVAPPTARARRSAPAVSASAASAPAAGSAASGFQTVSARRAAAAEAAPAEADEVTEPASLAEADEVTEPASLAEALPLADGDEELQVLYLRVQEMQAGQVGVGWDGPAVSLGAAPDSTPAAHSGWMQVRVQR